MASNRERFRSALRLSIKDQMEKNPERFAKFVLDDKEYPTKFAEHLMAKVADGQVVVINETVAAAMMRLEKPASFEAVYQFLGVPIPVAPEEVSEDEQEEDEQPLHSFKGC